MGIVRRCCCCVLSEIRIRRRRRSGWAGEGEASLQRCKDRVNPSSFPGPLRNLTPIKYLTANFWRTNKQKKFAFQFAGAAFSLTTDVC
jgi:hypothetical protein